jgi:hypothetical protein
MDFFFQDPDEIRLSPEEVRLREVEVFPMPDGKRIKVLIELDPFLKKPSLEISVATESGKEVAHSSILETMTRKNEIVMHLREVKPSGEYTLATTVYYQSLPEPSNTPQDMALPDPLIVDHRNVIFSFCNPKPEP